MWVEVGHSGTSGLFSGGRGSTLLEQQLKGRREQDGVLRMKGRPS